MYEIHDKTLGIVGLGTIGKKVARLARAFGMRVQYYDIARLPEHEEDALRRQVPAVRASCCAPPTSCRCTCR